MQYLGLNQNNYGWRIDALMSNHKTANVGERYVVMWNRVMLLSGKLLIDEEWTVKKKNRIKI